MNIRYRNFAARPFSAGGQTGEKTAILPVDKFQI
jgi:hypothetical protein